MIIKKMSSILMLLSIVIGVSSIQAVVVRDVMSPCVIGIDGADTVRKALALMEERKIHNLFVLDGARATGVLLFDKAQDADPKTAVKDLQVPLLSVSGSQSIKEAQDLLMQQGQSIAAVNDDAITVGVISLQDLVGAPCVAQGFNERQTATATQLGNKMVASGLTIGDIMSPCLISIDAQATAKQAIDLMNNRSIHNVIVLDKGTAVGSLRLVDALKAKPDDVVTTLQKELITVQMNDSTESVAQQLVQKQQTIAAVNQVGRTIGVVTEHDFIVVPCIAQALAQKTKNRNTSEPHQSISPEPASSKTVKDTINRAQDADRNFSGGNG